MKRIIAIAFGLLSAHVFAHGQNVVPEFRGSASSSIGIVIEELGSGRRVADHNSSLALIPASTMKAAMAAVAQSSLPTDFCFATTVSARGRVVGRVLEGNLVVVGGADPTVASRHFPGRKGFVDAVADRLSSCGIDSISGRVVMDGSVLPPLGVSPYWLLEDTAWEYGAGLYGLNYADNSFSMTAFADDSVDSVPEGVVVVNRLRRGRNGDDVVAMRGEGSPELTLTGTVSSKGYWSRYSTPDPQAVMHQDIVKGLQRRHIGVGGADVDGGDRSVATLIYHSPQRDEMLRVTMFKSVNLFAEAMLRAPLLASGGQPGFADAAAFARVKLAEMGCDPAGMRLCDGSGLAVTNRVTPNMFAQLLRSHAADSAYTRLFPRAGIEGSVTSLLSTTRLAGQLRLKSGTMTGVMCYVGYKVDAADHPTHSVVIMINGSPARAAEMRTAVGNYLLTVFPE